MKELKLFRHSARAIQEFNDYVRIYNLHFNENYLEKIDPLELMELRAGDLRYLFYLKDYNKEDL